MSKKSSETAAMLTAGGVHRLVSGKFDPSTGRPIRACGPVEMQDGKDRAISFFGRAFAEECHRTQGEPLCPICWPPGERGSP